MLKKIVSGIVMVHYLFIAKVHSYLELDLESDRFPFDRRIHEDALDPALCRRQLDYLRRNNSMLLARFLDAGIRVPRGILMGNTVDLGNFHQCLAINEVIEEMSISGKYCRIQVPINQDLHLPEFSDRSHWTFDPSMLHVDENILERLEAMNIQKKALKFGLPPSDSIERIGPDNPLTNSSFELAICIPRPCTTEQAINGLLFNLTRIGFDYKDVICRLPDDRPWVPADYVAIVLFSIIGCLTLISTVYDLYQSVYLKKDRKEIDTMYSCFSVYTNTRRLLTFNSSPGSIECLDGIRTLAMVWVILGHSFSTIGSLLNPVEGFMWSISLEAIWITAGPLTVDTFFFLSGLLLVYTTIGKLGSMELLKNLHLFYLLRILRMFPILAAVVLFESSFYFRLYDGPEMERVALKTFKCREYWWSTLLYIQNFLNPSYACVEISWYLAIDMHLHILSPIVLFWVLSNKKSAWTALNIGLIASLTASTVYIFFKNFPSAVISPNRQDEMGDYFWYYYMNTLTRASPFFVGMLYGYLLYLWRQNKAYVPKNLTTVLLLCSLSMLLVVMYCSHIPMTLEWSNQLADNIFNSFLRPLWALCLGWIIFACVQGRAEPINWFLSLQVWKLPARVSYAMYLTHYPIMFLYYRTRTTPTYFTIPTIMFNFFAFMTITFIVSFLVTLLIDSPFSTIFKQIFGSPKKSREPKLKTDEDYIASDSKSGIANKGFKDDREVETLHQLSLQRANEELKLHVNGTEENVLFEEESKTRDLNKQV